VERRGQVTYGEIGSTGNRRNPLSRRKAAAFRGWHDRMNREVGSGRHGCKSGKVKVLPPSVACFRRLAYPMHASVTMRDLLGCKSHGCPASFLGRSGRGDLGGEQARRPERKE